MGCGVQVHSDATAKEQKIGKGCEGEAKDCRETGQGPETMKMERPCDENRTQSSHRRIQWMTPVSASPGLNSEEVSLGVLFLGKQVRSSSLG